MNLDQLRQKLADRAKLAPHSEVVVSWEGTTPHGYIRDVLKAAHALNLTATLGKRVMPAPSSAPATASSPGATPATATVNPPAAPAPTAPATAAATPVKLRPLPLYLRPDGNVDFEKATLSLDELKTKLDGIAKTTPTQPISIRGRDSVTEDQLRKVVALCQDAKLKVHVVWHHTARNAPAASPAVPASGEAPAANLPAPGLILHPAMTPTPATVPPATTTPAPGP